MTTQLALINGEHPRPSRPGMLDERTKQVGRLGVEQARAALIEASRRASERTAERVARREQELMQRAELARRAAARRAEIFRSEGPGSEAA